MIHYIKVKADNIFTIIILKYKTSATAVGQYVDVTVAKGPNVCVTKLKDLSKWYGVAIMRLILMFREI